MPSDKSTLYKDSIYSTTVVCEGKKNTLLDDVFYSDELEKYDWVGTSDTLRTDVKRGRYGGSFEDKTFLRKTYNDENLEIAITSEFQDYPDGKAKFIFEVYKVPLEK